MPARRILPFLCALITAGLHSGLRAEEVSRATDRQRFVAHEWGTFTSLQNAAGRDLGAINIDDEPVPSFVHNLSRYLLQPTFLTSHWWRYRMKGVPRRHPLVTMRLETPVIYFHLPEGVDKPVEVDVRVRFLGGWLTEFWPDAKAKAPGLKNNPRFSELGPDTVGSLHWPRLRVGAAGKFPPTDEPVWTTPRKVDSDAVVTQAGESEQYIFYRGVARQRAPLRVVTVNDGRAYDLRANFAGVPCDEKTEVPALWLTEIRADGKAAYREIGALSVTQDEERSLARIEAEFAEDNFDAESLRRLKQRMHAALCEDGLYADEATAMLETWNRAYFESPGRRLFYLVPRTWTDHILPLEISEVDAIERVLMGRIELVTDEQRRVLAEIAAGEKPNADWIKRIPKGKPRDDFLAGRQHFGELGVEIPAHYRRYLSLGRFRSALVVEEERRRPTPALTAFIEAYGLRPYRQSKSSD